MKKKKQLWEWIMRKKRALKLISVVMISDSLRETLRLRNRRVNHYLKQTVLLFFVLLRFSYLIPVSTFILFLPLYIYSYGSHSLVEQNWRDKKPLTRGRGGWNNEKRPTLESLNLSYNFCASWLVLAFYVKSYRRMLILLIRKNKTTLECLERFLSHWRV